MTEVDPDLAFLEQRVGELFAATKDQALSVGDLARLAFDLPDGVTPGRRLRRSATRAAHRLLRRIAAVKETIAINFDQIVAETTTKLGRGPRRCRDPHYLSNGDHYIPVDEAFADAMETSPIWPLRLQAWLAMKRFDDALTSTSRGGWRATETKDRRLWFHPGNFPVRVWAVGIEPQGIVWADAEIIGIDDTYVRVRYRDAPARLSRAKLARSWTLYRNVYFSSSCSGYAARSFDQMWQQRYWRAGNAAPPAMQIPLAAAIKLLGVPVDFSRGDIVAAFRRKALQCHPDHGGTEEQFIELVKARDRLLAALGTGAAKPKMPEFAAKGVKLRYGVWRPARSAHQLGHTRRLAG